ncbi:MAG: DegT/DnrJ/EryC1/StrS family aminotransferase [Anaerolineae bacterium]
MIPIAEPSFEGRELEYVTDCVRSGWVSSLGTYVRRFEQEFAAYCGVRFGVATHNGTVALHLVLAALGIGPGDEVILPSLTFVATANAVAYTGARPVFVDSERHTWNIDPEAAARAVTPRTRAIIAVHLYGHPADMDPLRALADRHGLILIEDAAEAHGARYKGRRVGSLSDVAVFSFFGNKIITTGEGGMVLTDDAALAERCFFLENQARQKENPYWHPEIGYNYRMTNLQAALGVAQLERIEDLIAVRVRNAAHYSRRLSKVPGLSLPPCAEWAENVYWMYSVLVEDGYGLDRDSLMVRLRERGIDSRPVFYPIHTLPMYNTGLRLPVAEEIGRKGVNLPSGATLTAEQVDVVCDALAELGQREG